MTQHRPRWRNLTVGRRTSGTSAMARCAKGRGSCSPRWVHLALLLLAALLQLSCGEERPASSIPAGGSGGDSGLGGSGGTISDAALDAVQDAGSCTAHCGNAVRDCGEISRDCGGECGPCAPVQLADVGQMGGYPRVAVASPERVMLVWHRDAGNNDARLRWRCFSGDDWSPVAQVTPGVAFEGYPWIVADSGGAFHVVHSNGLGDARTVHYNRYEAPDCAGSWGDPAEVLPRAADFSAVYPSVGVDPSGGVHVTFSQSLALKPATPPCATDQQCSSGTHCYTLGGYCIADYAQYYVRRAAGSLGTGVWSTPELISAGAPGKLAHHGAVSVVDDESVHVAWMHGDPNREIFYARFDGQSWGAPEDTGIGAHMGDVQSDGQSVFVFSNTARFTKRALAAGKWEAPMTVATGPTVINLIKLRLDAQGRLHAVWNQAHRVMYSMTNATGDWLSAKPVSPPVVDNQLYASEPSLDVDEEGNVHFVWAQASVAGDEFGSVWYLKSRYDEL